MDTLPAQFIRTDGDAAEAVFQSVQRPVIIYKHSPICGLSAMALREMERYAGELPSGTLLYCVDVVAAKPASRKIEELTGIPHESPQVLLLRKRNCVFSASHRAIRVDALRQAFAAAYSPWT